MEIATWQIIALILFAFVGTIENLSLRILTNAPIMAGAVTGLIIGDLRLGLMVGATLQLMVLGVGTYGGASIPDFHTGAIVGTVFSFISGEGIDYALAVAVPVGLLMVQLDVLARFANNYFLHRVDHHIENMDLKAIERNILYGIIPWGLSRAIPVTIMLTVGQSFITQLLESLPDWLMGGLQVAGGLLPVVGIAVLLRYLPVNKNIPYLLIGFFLAAYLGISMVGVAIVGVALAMLHFTNAENSQTVATTNNVEISSDSENTGGYNDGEYDE